MKSRNFEILRRSWPELASLGGFAEAYARDDPASALVKLRLYGENLTKDIYRDLSLPRPEHATFADLLGKLRRVGSGAKCLACENTGSLVIPVAVASRTLKTGANHVGTERPNNPHHVGECDVMPLPFVECFLGRLGKAEISNPGKSLLHSVVSVGAKQLQRAEDPEFVEQITANLVLSALAAVEGQLESGDAVPA